MTGRSFLASLTTACVVLSLAACGKPSAEPELPPAGGDPMGTAAKLSLGAAQGENDAGPFEASVNCSAAIGIVTDLARRMSLAENREQLRLMGRAADIYRRRAEAASSGSSAAAEIARVTRAKRDDASAQAQLAMACVRNLAKN